MVCLNKYNIISKRGESSCLGKITFCKRKTCTSLHGRLFPSRHIHCKSKSRLTMHTVIIIKSRSNYKILNKLYCCKTTLVYPLKMEYGWNLWLKSISMYMHHKHFYWYPSNPLCTLKVLSITEIAISCRSPHFYEVNWIRRKWLAHGGIPKIFFLDHFSTSFLGQEW